MWSLFHNMRYVLVIKLILCTLSGYAQNTFSKKIVSNALQYEVKLQGIDFATIENSLNNEFEIVINDKNGLVTKNNISCSENYCLAEIQATQNIDNPLTNKINQFTQQPPTNVSVKLKIPRQKQVILSSKIIDIASKSFEGDLKIFIEKGMITSDNIKGSSLIEFSSGSFYGYIDDHAIDIYTRRGKVMIDDRQVKAVYKKEGNSSKKLAIRTTNGVIHLKSTSQ